MSALAGSRQRELFDAWTSRALDAVREAEAWPPKRGANKEMLVKLELIRDFLRDVAGDQLVYVFGTAGSDVAPRDGVIQVHGGWERGERWVAEVFAEAASLDALLRRRRETCECLGGPPCPCPDCDHAPCSYHPERASVAERAS